MEPQSIPWPRPNEIPGPPCYCGRSGCVETFLSGPALAADHRRHGGRHLSAREIADFAARGDAECGVLSSYIDRLARALALVINLIDPDVIVLGAAFPAYRRYTSRSPSYGGGTSSPIV